MKYISIYSKSDLRADAKRRKRGEPLTCPNCGWTDPPDRPIRLYDIHVERGPGGGIGYSYRLCKVCGFAQDTDGGEAYRVWLSVHECHPRVLPDGERRSACRHCGKALEVRDGVAAPHRCGKYLRQGDIGYCCSTCGGWLGIESKHPLPARGEPRSKAPTHC